MEHGAEIPHGVMGAAEPVKGRDFGFGIGFIRHDERKAGELGILGQHLFHGRVTQGDGLGLVEPGREFAAKKFLLFVVNRGGCGDFSGKKEGERVLLVPAERELDPAIKALIGEHLKDGRARAIDVEAQILGNNRILLAVDREPF